MRGTIDLVASSAPAYAVATTSPRRPGTTGRHLAAAFASALVALAAWWLITTLTAERAGAQIVPGSAVTNLTEPLTGTLPPVLAPATETVDQTLGAVVAPVVGDAPITLPPAITDVTDPLLGQVHDTLPPAITDVTDPLLGQVHDALPPEVTPIVDPILGTVGGVLPPGVIPPGVIPPGVIPPGVVPSVPNPLDPVFDPPAIPGIGPLPGTASGGPGSSEAPAAASTQRSTISRLAGFSDPSVSSPGSASELRLGDSGPGQGGGRDPALPTGPAAPVSGTSGSGSHAGGARDGPDATLVAAILMAAAGAFALSRARRPLWTDWVALAGARPG